MSIIYQRPLQIGAPSWREAQLYVHANQTDENNPSTVIHSTFPTGGMVAKHSVGASKSNTLSRYNWMRFAVPLKDPEIWWQNDVFSTGTVSMLSFSTCKDVVFQVYGMTQDWDHTTLCWSNQPTLLGTEPSIQFRMRQTSSFNFTTEQDSEIGRSLKEGFSRRIWIRS